MEKSLSVAELDLVNSVRICRVCGVRALTFIRASADLLGASQLAALRQSSISEL